MTSFFLVLIVRPKLSQAAVNLFMLICISDIDPALSAQSSANRKSRRTVSFTLVRAWSLLRLNRLPSIHSVPNADTNFTVMKGIC